MSIFEPDGSDIETSGYAREKETEDICCQPHDSNQNPASKSDLIAAACAEKNTPALVDLATTSHGLLDDKLRRAACMFPLCTSTPNPAADGLCEGLSSWDWTPKSRLEAKTET